MLPLHATPVLLTVLVGLLLGFVGWGVARERTLRQEGHLVDIRDGWLPGLMALAGFSLAVFVACLLVALGI